MNNQFFLRFILGLDVNQRAAGLHSAHFRSVLSVSGTVFSCNLVFGSWRPVDMSVHTWTNAHICIRHYILTNGDPYSGEPPVSWVTAGACAGFKSARPGVPGGKLLGAH